MPRSHWPLPQHGPHNSFSTCPGKMPGANALVVNELTGETSLPEEITGPQERDDTLLALIGDDGELNPAAHEIEDRVGRVALPEDDILGI